MRGNGSLRRAAVAALLLLGMLAPVGARASYAQTDRVAATGGEAEVSYGTLRIDNLDIFYREAGPKDAPTLVLLHGFPTSSQMFRGLIPRLATRYHVVAPDYPGFGQSSMPSPAEFDYTFENLSRVTEKFIAGMGIERYSLYVMDYGAPIGYRIASRNPGQIQGLIIQNGNAYEEGLREFWDPFKAYWRDPSPRNRAALRKLLTLEATRWQYTHGVRDLSRISPDNWTLDQRLLDRPGNQEIQLALFYDYGTNVPLYATWQEYFRKHQPPTLIVWGKNDHIFPAEGAHPYKRDLETVELHLLDTGHFALEEEGERIAGLIDRFLSRHVRRGPSMAARAKQD